MTSDVQWYVNGNPFFGVVLHGLGETLGAESDQVCLSKVNNIQLRLRYAVS